MSLNKKLLQELKKRSTNAEKSFQLEESCFEKQLDFINDTAKRKIAVTSRRAGKTSSCSRDLFNTALTTPGHVLYVTLSRVTAKRIIWKELIQLNETYRIGAKVDNSELSITMPNGNVIYISGAKDESEIEKFRGLALQKVYIDEAQAFRGYISEFIDDVLEPCLMDYDGTLVLIGTPGPVKAGFFYDCWVNPEWSQHKWTMHDNPFILSKSGKDPEQMIEEVCRRRGVQKSDPSIQREFYGNWEDDKDSLVFRFDERRNIYTELEPTQNLEFVLGVDIGWNDADAIAVLAYSHITQNCYLVEEFVKSKQTISELTQQVSIYIDKYKPVRMVMDAGALGKKIQEEIRQRYGINLEAAEKNRKLEFIQLFNDDLRTGKFKTLPESRFQEDSMLVQWDYSTPERPKISKTYHTDIGDAILYAWRECKHYFKIDVPPKYAKQSEDYMNQLEQREVEELEKRLNKGDFDVEYDLNHDISDEF